MGWLLVGLLLGVFVFLLFPLGDRVRRARMRKLLLKWTGGHLPAWPEETNPDRIRIVYRQWGECELHRADFTHFLRILERHDGTEPKPLWLIERTKREDGELKVDWLALGSYWHVGHCWEEVRWRQDSFRGGYLLLDRFGKQVYILGEDREVATRRLLDFVDRYSYVDEYVLARIRQCYAALADTKSAFKSLTVQAVTRMLFQSDKRYFDTTWSLESILEELKQEHKKSTVAVSS